MNELKVRDSTQNASRSHSKYVAAPEFLTAPERTLLTPLSALGLISLSCSAAFPPSLVGQFPVLRHGAVQPSGPPPSTSKRTSPRGAIPPAGCRTAAPSHVPARRRAESPRGGRPKQPPWSPQLRALGSTQKAWRRQARRALPPRLFRPPTPAQRARGMGYTISPVPEVATALVTDVRLLQPRAVRKVETR